MSTFTVKIIDPLGWPVRTVTVEAEDGWEAMRVADANLTRNERLIYKATRPQRVSP